jgi:hypothetical protein
MYSYGMEQVTLSIPDNIAANIQGGSTKPLERRLLELAAIQAYESDLITGCEVMEMLGFESREELYTFFKDNNVRDNYGIEDLEKDSAALGELLRQYNR